MSKGASAQGRPHRRAGPVLRLATVLVFLMSAIPAIAGDATYQDPRRPSFSMLIPDGWSVERTKQGVTIKRGSAYIALWVQPGEKSPGSMLVMLRPQFERQWQNFREIESDQVMLGGHRGAYAVYTGTPPSGVSSIIKVATMTNGQMTYTLFIEAHADEFSRVKRDLDRIVSSLAVEKAG